MHPQDAADHLANTGMGRAVLATIPEQLQVKALGEVCDVLVGYVTRHGVELEGGILLPLAQVASR